MTELTREQLFDGMAVTQDRVTTEPQKRKRDIYAAIIWDIYFAHEKRTNAELAAVYGIHPDTVGKYHRSAIRILRHPDRQKRFNALYPHWQETPLYRVVKGQEELWTRRRDRMSGGISESDLQPTE